MKEDKCPFCKGNIEKKKIDLDLWVGKELIVMKDVPAKTCEECGEKFLSAKVYAKVDKLVKNRSKAKKNITVPVIDYHS